MPLLATRPLALPAISASPLAFGLAAVRLAGSAKLLMRWPLARSNW
ncbi:hypothetical protein QC826_22170 [Rugamonas sp. DEMB1]|nr:hypothetical protein [Rugamonas sp. DEMB1]WGG49270.1 hypothetical protein QC826_22170 [Rugamonas sp. DEMB1]